MKFKINTITLYNALSKVSHIVNSKSPLQSLNGIYFSLDNDSLTLIGSDNEITIKCIVSENIEIIKQGKIIIPKFIVEIIRKINDDVVAVELMDNSLILVKSKKSEFKINGINAEMYPNIDFSITGENLNISNNDLRDIINQTIFATSQEVIRPVLQGVNMTSEDGVLTCVATDSFRLAKKVIKIDNNNNFNINVPAKCLNELNKLLLENNNLDIYISQQRILFNLDNLIIQSRLINGNYPSTNNLIPDNFESILTVNKALFKEALERANILSINTASYTVNLEKNSHELVLTSKNQEVGSINENIDYVSFEGNNIYLSFNSKFVVDALKAFDDENIIFYFNGSMNPFIIKSENNQSCTQLILPIKVH
jgi:DNA polymerase-3 subunit beta